MSSKSLREILDTMDVPENHKADFNWLLRNLCFRNSKHPEYETAIALIKQMVRGTISNKRLNL